MLKMELEELSNRILDENEKDCTRSLASDGRSISHYGVLGMKWGVRKEYEPHPRKKSNRRVRKGLSSSQKKAIAIGTGLTVAALAGYGMYKSGMLDELIDVGKSAVDGSSFRESDKVVDFVPYPRKANPTRPTVSSMMSDVMKVNPTGGRKNCLACSIATEIRRRGFDVTAVYDFEGIQKRTDIYSKIFKDVKVQMVEGALNRKQNMRKTLEKLGEFPNGARGMLNISFPRLQFDHAMSWEKIDGVVHIVDGQSGVDFTDTLYDNIFKRVGLDSVRYARLDNLEIDFNSEALKKMVK